MEKLNPQLKIILERLDQKLDSIIKGRTADRKKLDALSEKLDATFKAVVELKSRLRSSGRM